MTDVEMESVVTCEYDPENMDLEGPLTRMATATVEQLPNMAPLIKLGAASDLKDFYGRHQIEDQARS
uniref:Uncharacterized protein n=1 Tax=Peronospora matthiolae TaxID=2874970 RepID=A0AAV1U8M3_9STRA